jgi:hypothetical protein
MDYRKQDLKNRIDAEHGEGYSKNINLNGYTVCYGDAFISFHFIEMDNVNSVFIDYMYVTKKSEFIKLWSFCTNFWTGNKVQFIYYSGHRRVANFDEKYLTAIDFHFDRINKSNWKSPWKSTNGFTESEGVEAFY